MTETTTLTEAPTFEGLTAEQWRAKAQGARRESLDSFDRCDTDGFLSQWASDQMAARYSDCARIAETGGVIVAEAFVDIATGELLVGDWRSTQFGSGYAVEGRRDWLFPSSARKGATRRRNDERKGIRRVWANVPMRIERSTGIAVRDVEAVWTLNDTEALDLYADHED